MMTRIYSNIAWGMFIDNLEASNFTSEAFRRFCLPTSMDACLLDGIIGTILGFYGNNGKENGNYYTGAIYTLLVPFWVP